MFISLRKALKDLLKAKEQGNSEDYHNSKELDLHDQDVVNIIKLMPLAEFDDGIDKSAFLLDPKLLSGFLGTELGGLISDISNDFDFGFETTGVIF